MLAAGIAWIAWDCSRWDLGEKSAASAARGAVLGRGGRCDRGRRLR
jgi:hypothetical protein